MNTGWCRCGRMLRKQLDGTLLCPRHKEDIQERPIRQRIGKYSGESKSPHKFGDYQ